MTELKDFRPFSDEVEVDSEHVEPRALTHVTEDDTNTSTSTSTSTRNNDHNDNEEEINRLKARITFLEERLLSIGASIDLKHGESPAEEHSYNKIDLKLCCDSPIAPDLDSYIKQSVFRSVLKRLPWLLFLLLVQSFSASILSSFDTLLTNHFVIAFFVPMLTGAGGNAGSQPAMMVTRALAMPGTRKPLLRLVIKEAKVALCIASALGLLAFLRVLAEYSTQPTAAFAVGISLFVEVLVSVAAGVAFSIMIDKFKNCDPADGSGPLVATVCDLVGISILCGIAGSLLG